MSRRSLHASRHAFILVVLVALEFPVASRAQLAWSRNEHEIIVISTAKPTWKLVLAVSPRASEQRPGGGTVRALYIPANSDESVVGPDPGQFCCAGWGLDNLEWRYVENKKGVRSPLGTTATIESFEIVKQSPEEIVIKFTGNWRNVSHFTRVIKIGPNGYRTRLDADWAGPVNTRGMWWLISLFRSSWVDSDSITIADADTEPKSLPVAKEGVFSLPDEIGFPYEVSFPLRPQPTHTLCLRVHSFGTDQPADQHYELWPEEKGYVMFYPRWVSRNFDRRRYTFDYEWTIGEALQMSEPNGPEAQGAQPESSNARTRQLSRRRNAVTTHFSNQTIHE